MNYSFIKSLFVVMSVSVAAAVVQAAPTNTTPKPSCPMGQVPVNKSGLWVCEELKLKANTQGENTTAPVGGTIQVNTPKPDLVVYSVEKSNSDNKIMTVHIQNIGAVKSSGGKVGVSLSSGAAAMADMPDINPGQIRLVYVKFRTDIPARTRASVKADSTNVVSESNESNNVKQAAIN